jgi:hypothetical protein
MVRQRVERPMPDWSIKSALQKKGGGGWGVHGWVSGCESKINQSVYLNKKSELTEK